MFSKDRFSLFFLGSFLYTFIDGSLVFYLVNFLTRFSSSSIAFMSIRYLVGLLLDLFLVRKFYLFKYKQLLLWAIATLFIGIILLIPGNLQLTILSLAFLGIVDVLYWSSATAYIERVSKNFDADISKFLQATLLGYGISFVYGKALLLQEPLGLLGELVLASLVYLAFNSIPPDTISSSVTRIRKLSLEKSGLFISFSFFLLFSWLAVYFLSLPNAEKILGLALAGSIAYGVYNLARYFGALSYLKLSEHCKAKEKLLLGFGLLGILATASLALKWVWLALADIFLLGIAYSWLYDLWFSYLREKFPEISKSGEIGSLATLGSELAFVSVPVFLGIFPQAILQALLYIIIYYIIIVILVLKE